MNISWIFDGSFKSIEVKIFWRLLFFINVLFWPPGVAREHFLVKSSSSVFSWPQNICTAQKNKWNPPKTHPMPGPLKISRKCFIVYTAACAEITTMQKLLKEITFISIWRSGCGIIINIKVENTLQADPTLM